MSRQGTLGAAVLLGMLLASAPAAHATWGIYLLPARPTPPDQSWLNDLPERARARGKVAVFVFKGDDVYQPMRGAVVNVLRRRGLNVTVTLKPMDNAVERRETAQAMNLAAYVEGQVTGEGARQTALVRLYSGITGHPMASARFTGPTPKIVDAIARTLWTRVGPPVLRACTSASRPRRAEREPLRIEAGDDDDSKI
jgi:hypothetical protein